MDDVLVKLEGGALTDLGIGRVEGFVTVSDAVVIDSHDMLRVFDVNAKPVLELPKEQNTLCFAYKGSVFCCTKGLCGFVEPGKSTVYVDGVNEGVHKVYVVSESIPLYVVYRDREVFVEGQTRWEAAEEKASVLEPHRFEVTVRHLLGSAKLFPESPAIVPEIEADATIYTSTGRHTCGGAAIARVAIKKASVPAGHNRIKIVVYGHEVPAGNQIDVCLEKPVKNINIAAVDTVAGSGKVLVSIEPKVVEVPPPASSVKIEHRGPETTISIESDATVAKAVLRCGNGDFDLEGGRGTVRECVVPATLEYTLLKEGFVFRRAYNIELVGLLKSVVDAVASAGAKEYREGGFVAKFVVPPVPEVNPLTDFEAVVKGDVVLRFRSRYPGVVAVIVNSNRVATDAVKTGVNELTLPLSDRYIVVYYTGFKVYTYTVEIPVKELLKVAIAHAKTLADSLTYRQHTP